jgi:hypothetical protein
VPSVLKRSVTAISIVDAVAAAASPITDRDRNPSALTATLARLCSAYSYATRLYQARLINLLKTIYCYW